MLIAQGVQTGFGRTAGVEGVDDSPVWRHLVLT
jgi:hypothetical protein